MKITDVRIRKIEGRERLRGIASITLDDCFVVHEIKIIDGDNGLFIAMPSRKNSAGEFKDLAHPILAETRKEIEDAVLKAFNEA